MIQEKYNKRDRKKIKQFSRFLKELGIYNAWIRERLKETYGVKDNVFNVVCNYETITAIIDFSFTWDYTKNPLLWERLCMAADKSWEFIDSPTIEECVTTEVIEYFKKCLKDEDVI